MMSQWNTLFVVVLLTVSLVTLLLHNHGLIQEIWEKKPLGLKSCDNIKKIGSQASFSSGHNNNSLASDSNRNLQVSSESHVRKCLSGKIIGTVPNDIKLEPFGTILKPINAAKVNDKESFTNIFANKLWGTNETSASGRGSGYYWTQEMAPTLHVLVNQLKVILKKSRIKMLDIPCGDMTWMSRFLASREDIDYTGVDIVSELIARHKKDFLGKPYKFINANIIQVGIKQSYDLIFSRQMLQHLQNSNIEKFLKMASESGSKYLLTTTFPSLRFNRELRIGSINDVRFRQVNLEVPPFSLSAPVCTERDGPSSDEQHHHISLWKLPLHRVALCSNPHTMFVNDTEYPFYACGQWGRLGNNNTV